MDLVGDSCPGPYRRLENPNETSGEFESAQSSICDRKGSVNSFLEEAEIIPQPTDEGIVKANQCMRKKLRSFFMNPVQKYKQRGRFPWKLCIQVFKIVIATVQMCFFGFHSFEYVKQHLDMTMALSRIFLKDWAADVAIYPPSTGPYAVYTIPEFYDNINNVIQQFTKINSMAVGTFEYDSPNGTLTPIEFCVSQYKGHIFAGNSTIEIKANPKENCLVIPALYPANSPLWDTFSLAEYLDRLNNSLNFRTLVHAKLNLRLKTIFIKSMSKLDFPECYRLKVRVKYDNSEHDGQLIIDMNIHSTKFACHVNSKARDENEELYYLLRQILNSFVIIFSLLSGILCLRSLYSGYKLARETVWFFKHYYQKDVPFIELIDFIDFWYVNIAVSDIMLIFGSLIKLQIEERSAEGSEYAKCSLLLGIGNLLIWVGILRYLGFFPKYNMLILTLKRALPNVLRFLICAIFLFMGYCFCGWIVLAPYHIKFRSLSRTAECLFAIMNGDDMFATFALLDTNLDLIWWFTRLFLYSFLLIFIYVVVSLFISVIMDTFETIKHLYVYGAPPTSTIEIFLAADSYPTVLVSSTEPLNPEREHCAVRFKKLWRWFKAHLRFRH